MNKELLQPLLDVVLQNDAVGGTNLALLHIIEQNNLAELEASLSKYLQADELFYEMKADEIIDHSPKELSLLGQEKYLIPVLNFAAGRAYNDTISRMQKECDITSKQELNKLKSIVGDMYLESCQDTPDAHKIKALSSTLLGSLNNDDRFILTSQDSETVLHALHDNISSQLHHAIAQEIKNINNIKDITFKGDEVLWRGITLPEHTDINKFLSSTHIYAPFLYKFSIPMSEDAPDYSHRVCTSAGLDIPMAYAEDSTSSQQASYLLEIRPKSGQKATFLADHHLWFGLTELEIDFDKIDTHEVYAAYKIQSINNFSEGYSAGYKIEQASLNKNYIAREDDANQNGHLHFATGDTFMLTRPPSSMQIPTHDQLESGKLISGNDATVANYSFTTNPNYKMFESAFKKFGGSPSKEDCAEDYTPPKIDLSTANDNRQETKEYDAILYPLAWPHNADVLVSEEF